MNVGAILVGIGLLVGVGAFVARPLFERSTKGSAERSELMTTQGQLTARRDAVYALIRELDADHLTGKINDQDYEAQRERYVAEGVAILKQMDGLPEAGSRTDLDAEIEAQILALRQTPAPPPENGQQPSTRFCTQCGEPVDSEHRFCAQCGAPLKGVAAR
jgi:hypothetical protein